MHYSNYLIGIKYYQKIISCFEKEIDPIFKIFKNCKMDLQDSPARVFSIFQKNGFQDYRISIFNEVVLFSNYLKYFGVLEIQNNWCWESWSRPLGPKIMKIITFQISPN